MVNEADMFWTEELQYTGLRTRCLNVKKEHGNLPCYTVGGVELASNMVHWNAFAYDFSGDKRSVGSAFPTQESAMDFLFKMARDYVKRANDNDEDYIVLIDRHDQQGQVCS